MLAGRIEVTPNYVSQLACGQRSPSWATLAAIAYQGFEIMLATLMFGIDEDIGVGVGTRLRNPQKCADVADIRER